MFDKLRQMVLGLNARSSAIEEAKTLRQVVLGAAKLGRKPGALVPFVNGLAQTADFHQQECAQWLTTPQIEQGHSGPFDACDLSAWLAVARSAGVPCVPARHILHLSEEEAEVASGHIDLGQSPVIKRARKVVSQALATETGRANPEQSAPSDKIQSCINTEDLIEKLFSALDDVPEGWMVRTSHCGSSDLKALAGFGLAGPVAPEVRFGPDLEVGPGWVRNGNRRRVNTQDQRIISLHAQGPHRGMDFFARPWLEAARNLEGNDPHRSGTPFEGAGLWPMEWRAFVHDGKVVGVSNYYGFVGEATTENAQVALKVQALAAKMVDVLITQRLAPRFMSMEHARRNPQIGEILANAGHGENSISCTLDFLETKDGLLLLEGGPPSSPIGGGHPCCFAGCGGPPTLGNAPQTIGVAFRPMPHIIVADPATWIEGARTDCVLSWDETIALAQQ